MKPTAINGHNNVMGAPQGWDSTKHGDFQHIHIRAFKLENMPYAVSAWLPSAAEIAALKRGMPILLTVVGTRSHPVVRLSVGAKADLSPRAEQARESLEKVDDVISEFVKTKGHLK